MASGISIFIYWACCQAYPTIILNRIVCSSLQWISPETELRVSVRINLQSMLLISHRFMVDHQCFLLVWERYSGESFVNLCFKENPDENVRPTAPSIRYKRKGWWKGRKEVILCLFKMGRLLRILLEKNQNPHSFIQNWLMLPIFFRNKIFVRRIWNIII